ncbi:alpha/beta hydrolase, partial [Bacteroidota bacterium]
MRLKLSILILFLFFFSSGLFAYKVIEDVAAKAGGYDIPIKICLPDKAEGILPVMFFVHGGGWNGGDNKEVPDAQIPADCNFLCDQMGIIYVGLAYRCKGNNGTFNLALQDLEASVNWFEGKANEYNADMSRIGFSGGSAGTTLSAALAQRYPACKVYMGREGMYNILDMDTTLSNFPNAEARAAFGLVSPEQKLEASPFHNLRNKPAAALLLHGKDDWLCHYTQSVKYSEQLKKAGGKCKLVLYEGINHTCLNIGYPEVYKNSIMEIARLYARGYNIKKVDYKAIEARVDKKIELLYPYQDIPGSKLPGSWKSSRYGTLTLEENGKGNFVSPSGKQTKGITYKNNDSWFSVLVEGEERERVFYLRKNDNRIYQLI